MKIAQYSADITTEKELTVTFPHEMNHDEMEEVILLLKSLAAMLEEENDKSLN